ncbi:uracil-DNA glycosylase family protein [Marinobacterium lutimaris]|uniref:Uracil-DNA glycosylase, family 4 n=1 Tax=Marinobacterium lutimaris TaxID=568106 RepID=A0A1H5Z014_9GAMM|nr:uracil-DNA glycosylase, family 4 [Marinobacterium lutimaris]
MDVNFEELMCQVRACRLCEAQLPLEPRPIIQASPEARILIVGQAPGRKAHESGLPFDDASGDRLRQWLGLSREQFYDPALVAILPMGFCYPGTGKSGDLPPRPECAPAWRDKLMAELPNIQLTLLLGQYAQQYHFGAHKRTDKRTLTERVRDWQTTWPDLVSLPHPSPRNNLWLRCNPWFETELLPALAVRIKQLIP